MTQGLNRISVLCHPFLKCILTNVIKSDIYKICNAFTLSRVVDANIEGYGDRVGSRVRLRQCTPVDSLHE